MTILTLSFTALRTDKMPNIHPSFLPKFKGLNTRQCAFDVAEHLAGCSVHLVTPELDDCAFAV